MQKMRVFIAALILTLFGLNAVNQKNSSYSKSSEDQRKELDVFESLSKELFSMDFAAFKKKSASVSEEDQGALLETMAFDKDIKNIDARKKILFLASKMSDKPGIALYWAYKNNDKDAIQRLKKMGYLPSQALAVALALKDEKIMNSLLKEGVEVTSDSIRGLIIMNNPASPEYEKSKKLLKRLLPKVKNPNQLDNAGWNLLDYPSNAEIAQILFDAGVKLRKDKDVLSHHVGAVNMFQAIAKQNPKMEKPLKGKIALIKLYIEKGADPLKKNEQGKSAMDIANEKGLDEVVAIFQKKKK